MEKLRNHNSFLIGFIKDLRQQIKGFDFNTMEPFVTFNLLLLIQDQDKRYDFSSIYNLQGFGFHLVRPFFSTRYFS